MINKKGLELDMEQAVKKEQNTLKDYDVKIY